LYCLCCEAPALTLLVGVMFAWLVGQGGGWLLLTVGGGYSWLSSLYGYNRDAWMNDVQVKQSHQYQRDSMQIEAHAMSREEIRDRTQAKITKLSNYILVTTLVLALAAEMLVEGQIPPKCPDFVLNVYMLCLGSSMLYLVLSILFGVAASNVVYERSAELLTDKVPPPWQIIDKRMCRKKHEETTAAFDDRPWSEMLKPPLLRYWKDNWISRKFASLYGCVSGTTRDGYAAGVPVKRQESPLELPRHGGSTHAPSAVRRAGSIQAVQASGWAQPAPAIAAPVSVREGAAQLSFAYPLAQEYEPARSSSEEPRQGADTATSSQSRHSHLGHPQKDPTEHKLGLIKATYLDQWEWDQVLWSLLLRRSGLCASIGFKCLLEAYGYYSMATLFGTYGSQAWAFWGVQIIFTTLNAIIMHFMFRAPIYSLTVAVGPLCCAIASTSGLTWIDQILVPFCYLSHFAHSVLVYLTFLRADKDDKKELRLADGKQIRDKRQKAMEMKKCQNEEDETGSKSAISGALIEMHSRLLEPEEMSHVPQSSGLLCDAAPQIGCRQDDDDDEYSVPGPMEISPPASFAPGSFGTDVGWSSEQPGCSRQNTPSARVANRVRPRGRHSRRHLDQDVKSDAEGDGQSHAMSSDALADPGLLAEVERYLPFEIDGSLVLKKIDGETGAYITDNSEWQIDRKYMLYHKSRDMQDMDSEIRGPIWGEIVNGVETLDKKTDTWWVKVIRRGDADFHDPNGIADLAARLMRLGHLVVTGLWLLFLCWSIYKGWIGKGFSNKLAVWKQPITGPPVAGVVKLPAIWPSPFFEPHSVVCPRGQIFFGDAFRVFELINWNNPDLDNRVIPYPCDVGDERIADVAADCNATACWPVVLLEGKLHEPDILDCATGRKFYLNQKHDAAVRYAQQNHSVSYAAAQNGEVVQYWWSADKGAWSPRWQVAHVGHGNLKAIDIIDDRLLIFRQKTVEVRHILDGKVCGVWDLPKDVKGAGCAMAGGTAVLLLSFGQEKEGVDQSGVELTCAQLRGKQSCGNFQLAHSDHCQRMVRSNASLPNDRFLRGA